MTEAQTIFVLGVPLTLKALDVLILMRVRAMAIRMVGLN